MAEHDQYDNIIQYGDPKKRYHTYTLANEGHASEWPGIWWSRVYGDTADGDFLTEWEAWEWLNKTFPDKSCAVQEVVWVAEPTKWEERRKTGGTKRAYFRGGDM